MDTDKKTIFIHIIAKIIIQRLYIFTNVISCVHLWPYIVKMYVIDGMSKEA